MSRFTRDLLSTPCAATTFRQGDDALTLCRQADAVLELALVSFCEHALLSLGNHCGVNSIGRPGTRWHEVGKADAGGRLRQLNEHKPTHPMKRKIHLLIPSVAVSLALCLGLNSRADNPTDLGQQKKECEQQARPEVEQQRKEAEQKAEKTLDKEAIAALEDTTKAIKAISDNKTDEALAAIERATGKINILLARNPATALIPVALQVEVVEAAPLDLHAIKA